MVKKSAQSSGTSRIRFIMLEAELPDGDLSQITSAIQNALKPAPMSPRLPNTQIKTIAAETVDEETEPEDFEQLETENKPRNGSSRSRRPAKRKVVGDLDFESGTSLKQFASQYPPNTEQDRFLVALSWLKEHRPDTEVTADHLYTCYRTMDWPSGAKDFTQPLRTLKSEQYVDQGEKRGTYVINHVGEGRVKKLAEI